VSAEDLRADGADGGALEVEKIFTPAAELKKSKI
jgi:hypothetical protein